MNGRPLYEGGLSQAIADSRYGSVVTREVTFPLGGSGFTLGSIGVGVEVCARAPFTVPLTPTHYRFYDANYSAANQTAGGAALNAAGIWVGPPAYASTGSDRFVGAHSAAPTQVVNAYTIPAAGAEFDSGWIANTGQIVGMKRFVVTRPFNNIGGGGAVAMYSDPVGGVSFVGAGASTTGSNSGVPSGAISTSMYGDLRIALRFSVPLGPDGTPLVKIGLAMGDSTVAGNITESGLTISDSLAHDETWVGGTALASRALVVNAAVNGSTTGQWKLATDMTHAWLSRFHLDPTMIDFVFAGLGINDCSNGSAASIQQDNWEIIWANVRASIAPNAKEFFGQTITPGGLGSAFNVTGCTVASGSASVVVASTFGLTAGMAISGTGITAGTLIDHIDDATHITMNANGTANNSGLTLVAGTTAYVNTAAKEAIRQTMNAWLGAAPLGLSRVFDFDRALASADLSGVAEARFMRTAPHGNIRWHKHAATIARF